MFKIEAIVGIIGKDEDLSVCGAKRILNEYKIPFELIKEKNMAKKIRDYPLLLFHSNNNLNVKSNCLNNFLKSGGNVIFCGLLNFNDANVLDIGIEDCVHGVGFKLELEDNHPVVGNIKDREIALISKVVLIDDCKGNDVVGKVVHDGHNYPGIIVNKQKSVVYIPLDICEQVVLWESERYVKHSKRCFSDDLMIRAYNALPYKLNQSLKIYARKVRNRISSNKTMYTRCPVEYNCDTLRLLLINSIKYQILNSIGFLPTLGKWPFNYNAAMVITHDVDTYKDYNKGLPMLLEIEKKHKIKTTWNFVAQSSEYRIDNKILSELISSGYEVASHGLYHDRHSDKLSCGEREERMIKSKKIIENMVDNYEVKGFRSPGLTRTDDLCYLLDKAGYTYDMSFPDNDHYTLSRFGMGVSSHVPYNPILKIGNKYQESKILELPLAALQEINLFIDHKMDEGEALKVWVKKGEHIIEDGGLVVFLFHPSLFITKSRFEMYEALIKYFANRKHLWIATASDVVEWWNKRKLVNIASHSIGVDEWEVEISNEGFNNINGLELIMYVPKNKKLEFTNNSIGDVRKELKWCNTYTNTYTISIPPLKEGCSKKVMVGLENENTL